MKLDLNIGIYCRREESMHFQCNESCFAELFHLLPSYLHLQGAYFTKHKGRKDFSCLRWILIFRENVSWYMSYIWHLGVTTCYVSETTRYNRPNLSLLFALCNVSNRDPKWKHTVCRTLPGHTAACPGRNDWMWCRVIAHRTQHVSALKQSRAQKVVNRKGWEGRNPISVA